MQVLRKLLETRAARRAVLLLGIVAVLAIAAASIDLRPNLGRVKVAILSGSKGGNYFAVTEQLATEARRGKGDIKNVATQGSIENLERLSAARRTCDVHFALVQDGLDWPSGLELVARLPRPESVFFLGRDADRLHTLSDVRGFRVGIGPEGSGTARLAAHLLMSRDLHSLALRITNHPLDEQLSLLERGELDLGVLVMDERAALVENAVRDRGLAILNFAQAQAIARRFPGVHTGNIAAGQYDPVRMLPPTDKTVLQVDALLVGNGCASRSATTGLLTLLSRVFPDFHRRNKDTPNNTGLPIAVASQSFIEDGGADLATQHVPWATDIMPLSNWIYAITAVSILFNVVGFWSKFRLWRIDTHRIRAEQRLTALFRPGITPAEITRLVPRAEHRTAAYRAELSDLISSLETLSKRCRAQSLSWVTDMGQEMPYRYQEHLMSELLDAVRIYAGRLDEAAGNDALSRTWSPGEWRENRYSILGNVRTSSPELSPGS